MAPLRKESMEDQYMNKVAAGKMDILEKGTMRCQACGCEVLTAPDKEGKAYCPLCKGVTRATMENKETI